jgi:GTP-binding protein Era
MPTLWRWSSTPKRGIGQETRAIAERLKDCAAALPGPEQIDLVARETALALTPSQRDRAVRAHLHGERTQGGRHRRPADGVRAGCAARALLYPEDQAADLPPRLLAAEVTREQVFLQLHQELPYEAAVETEKWEDRPDGSVRVEQTIHVQREGQRAIFLGKGGARIKQIGARARHELSQMLERPVHLFLHVKVSERWPRTRRTTSTIGLDYQS